MRLRAGNDGPEHDGQRRGGRGSVSGVRALPAAAVMLAALGILCGCGSFFSSSSSTSHLSYVAGGVTDVAAYRIDNNSGAATSIFTAPFVAGNSPSSVVVHPSNQFLYVANAADSTISLFTINSASGALTEVLPRTSAGGLSPGFMIMDSGGSFLFVANQVSNDVWTFKIGTSGALTPVTSVSVGSVPGGLVLASSGILYVPVTSFSRIYAFSVAAGVLTPVPGQPFAVNNGVGGIAVDSGAKFLYATNPVADTLSGFAIQSGGGLVAMPGLTVGTGTTPVAVVFNLAGTAIYVANNSSDSVSQFTVDATTGVLTPFTTTTVVSGTHPAFFVTDPSGKFIYLGNTGSNSITEFSMNSGGSLNNIATISVGFVPRSFAVTP
jgi:6-phosphogluconolactonase (cycloisomerase 2 family)